MLCSTRVPAAGSSCLVDLESGQTILSESSSDRIENTAIAALMSAYTALALAEERNESLDIPLADVSNKSEFRKSESNLADAIEAVLLAADKEALQAIVRHFSADEATFVIEMNTKAHQLGMEQSFFRTPYPSEKHLQNQTSAADAARLCISLYQRYPLVRVWTSEEIVRFNNREIQNKNFFRQRSSAITGIFAYTNNESANGIILAEDRRSNGRTRKLLAVALNENDRESLIERISTLLLRGYRDYETIRLYKIGDIVGSAPVYKSNISKVKLKTVNDVFVSLTKERMLELGEKAVNISIEYHNPIVAPLKAETNLGRLIISVGDTIISTAPVVAAEDAERGGFLRRLTDTIKLAIYHQEK